MEPTAEFPPGGLGGGDGPGSKAVQSIIGKGNTLISTDVVLNSVCPPRRWSGAGVGIGSLRGLMFFGNLKDSKI